MDTACDVVQFFDSEEGHHNTSCSTCQDLPFRNKAWSPFYQLNSEDVNWWYTKVSYDSLCLSSHEGCPYCDLLFQFAKVLMAENIRHDMSELVTFKFGWCSDSSSDLTVCMYYEDLTVEKVFHLYVTEGKSDSYIKSCSKALLSILTFSRNRINLAKYTDWAASLP